MVSIELQEQLVKEVEVYARVVLLGEDKFGFYKNRNIDDIREEYMEKFYEDYLKICSVKRTAKKMARMMVNNIIESTITEIQNKII